MRVLVLGSFPEHRGATGQISSPEHAPLFAAARELGFELARRGHTLLVGSNSRNTIDPHVVDGMLGYRSSRSGPKPALEVHRPRDGKAPYRELRDAIDVRYCYYEEGDRREDKWFIAHTQAMRSCDAVLIVGGSDNTRIIGKLAVHERKPVLAIPTFGGASRELFEQLLIVYRQNAESLSRMDVATAAWAAGSAAEIVSVIEELAAREAAIPPHSYFISYSWNDAGAADHVEVLLLRRNRLIMRDETSLRIGETLNPAIRSLIEGSDTYIGLVSRNFHESSWCIPELRHALLRRAAGTPPRRMALLRLDDASIPEGRDDDLYARASTRDERTLAIRRLMDEEASARA